MQRTNDTSSSDPLSERAPGSSPAGQPGGLRMLLAAAIIVASATSGAWLAGLAASPDGVIVTPSATPVPRLPGRDVPGREVADLPRFPDAVRTDYQRGRQGALVVTELRYLVSAELDDVRSFYRRTFREYGWEVVGVDVARGEWVFLVASGRRVALVEIELRGAFIEIDLEVEAPAQRPRPSPRPEPPPPPPPPDDDDDDDDGDDDGTDD